LIRFQRGDFASAFEGANDGYPPGKLLQVGIEHQIGWGKFAAVADFGIKKTFFEALEFGIPLGFTTGNGIGTRGHVGVAHWGNAKL